MQDAPPVRRIPRLRRLPALAALLVLLVARPSGAQVALGRPEDPEAAARLAAVLADYDAWQRREFPGVALRRGDRSAVARFAESGLSAEGRRFSDRAAFRRRLEAVDARVLGERDRISRALLLLSLDHADGEYRHRTFLAPTTQRWGTHQTIGRLMEAIPLESPRDLELAVGRLEAAPAWIDAQVALLRLGLEERRTPPRAVMEGVDAQVDALLAEGGLDVLLAPFAGTPAGLSQARAGQLRTRAEAATAAIRARLEAYRTFLVDTYVPGCVESLAASDWPDGEAFYAHRIAMNTTLRTSARDVFEIGRQEVARLRTEMMAVIARTDFLEVRPELADAGDEAIFAAFIDSLRTSPRFTPASEDALLRDYRALCKRIDAELPRLFLDLPRLPYGVEPIPAFIAPQQTTAYYQPGSLELGQPGIFAVNTYRLDQRPTYEQVALALHEAVPGHHLQIALARELDDLPAFRRDLGLTAYVEGWALYAERLGLEMGLYDDPYDDFGRLLYEMWRACRLVVDPGLHAFGWTREEAIDYLLENTALSELNVRTEVDRYISWPGQALGYKVGELRIRALRAEAESRLGTAFDVRAFHRVLLSEGAVSLPILTTRVRTWIESRPIDESYD